MFTVTAISADGQVTDHTVNYTVENPVRHVRGQPSGTITFSVKVPRAGKLVVHEHASVAGATNAHAVSFGQLTTTLTGAGTHAITVGSGSADQRFLARAHSKHEKVVVAVAVTFAPRHGKGWTVTIQGVKISP
jgi:hypothetical protein